MTSNPRPRATPAISASTAVLPEPVDATKDSRAPAPELAESSTVDACANSADLPTIVTLKHPHPRGVAQGRFSLTSTVSTVA
jgi:hypothetical protein